MTDFDNRVPVTETLPEKLRGPDRPGHYFLWRGQRLVSDGPLHVNARLHEPFALVTVEHLTGGLSRVSARTMGFVGPTRVMTPAFQAPYWRQDELWNAAVDAIIRPLSVRKEEVFYGTRDGLAFEEQSRLGVTDVQNLCMQAEAPVESRNRP